MAYITMKNAVAKLGMPPNSLRKYADNGTIKSIRTPGGQRLFEVDEFLRTNTAIQSICYCRVSSQKQRDDLQRQIERMQAIYPQAEIIKDIGSGLNFKRKGLQTLLGRLLQGDKLRIVVSHRDRLARFGYDIIEYLVRQNGGEIVVLDNFVSSSKEAELTADLLAILHHFSCRMHGARSHQSKKDKDLPEQEPETNLPSMVRDFKNRLQRNSKSLEFGCETETLDGCG